MRRVPHLFPPAPGKIAAAACLAVGLLAVAAEPARAHGANFRDPSDSPPRSARPSPQIPVPPVTTAQPSDPIAPSWRPEGWYRWWELNAPRYLPTRPARLAPPGPPTTPGAPVRQAGAPWLAARREVQAEFLRLLDPEARTEPRLLAAALVGLGRVALDGRAPAVLRHYAADRASGFQVREAALAGIGLLRRDDPAQRLPLADLAALRTFLLARADDSQEPARTRAFALCALGLLADQGHASGLLERGGRTVTHALWQRLAHGRISVELSVALLTALGMQPPDGVPDGVVQGLEWMALGRRVRGRTWNAFERSHAVSALARLGKPGVDPFLLRLAGEVRAAHPLRAAAAIALLRRAPAMAPEVRVPAVQTLRRSADAPGTHWLVRSLSQLAVGALVGADVGSGSAAVIERTGAERWLRMDALGGPREGRPFCALALALAWRETRGADFLLSWGRQRASRTLKLGLERGGRSDRMLGAYAVGLGLVRAAEASRLLRAHLTDRERDGVLRGHSAAALGLLGERDAAVTTLLQATTRERGHVFLHLQAARALGWLGARGAFEGLRRDFAATDSPSIASALALGLAALDDPRALDELRRRLRDEQEHVAVRVSCAMALASLFGPEPGSSARRMTVDANYPALTGAGRRFLDLL